MGTRVDSVVRWLGRAPVARVGWWLLIGATALNGVVVGYGAVWFQLDGSAGRADLLISAGGYGAAAGVLLMAATGLVGVGGARPAAWTAAVLAALLAVGALRSALAAAAAPPDHGISQSPIDGAGGVLLLPWTLLLLAAGAVGTYRLVRPRHRSRP